MRERKEKYMIEENRKEDFGRERYREKHCRQQENEGENWSSGGTE